jgi:uncharacterized protein YndB with AHSA1/START domain
MLSSFMTAALLVAGAAAPASPDDSAAATNPVLARLANLVGGVWVNDNPKFPIEFRYRWIFGGRAIRSQGTIGKGLPNEARVEATLGYDPATKTVYYLDFHGAESVYRGTVAIDGDDLRFDFQTLIGPPASWRSLARFPDTDTYASTILAEKDGQWTPVVKLSLKRRSEAPADSGGGGQVTEGDVDAPIAAVWDALATSAGQESWNVAHAEIDVRVGGKMRTHYDPNGKIGDPKTIENTILAFEPQRMLTMQATGLPEGFPFPKAIARVWTVIYFDEIAPGRTHLRLVGLGYGDDDESQKLRGFFEKGNAYTLKKLQEHFAPKAAQGK